jgi:hypothetical protein
VDTAGRRQRTRTEEESRGEQRVSKKNPNKQKRKNRGEETERRRKGEFSKSARTVVVACAFESPGKASLLSSFLHIFCCRRRARGKGNLITFALCSARVA